MTPDEQALVYAESGWPVFPCKPWPDKSPYTYNGLRDASRDHTQIAAWWKRWPKAIIGLPTGKPSGIVVLDIDVKEGSNGFWTLADDFAIYDPPITPQVFTPSGGRHLHFDSGEHEIRNTNGGRGRGLGSGLDWRGDGGYVILPSEDSGYAWHSRYNFDTLTPLTVPSALLPRELSCEPAQPVERADGLSPYAEAAVESACRNIVHARNGEQEHVLSGEPYSIGRLAGAGAVPEGWALRMLLRAAYSIPDYDPKRPWKAKDVDKKVKSAFARGMRRPREVRYG